MPMSNLNNINVPVATPSRHVDAKREFEQLMDELCMLANKVRVIVGSLQDPLLKQMKINNRNQKYTQFKSMGVQIASALVGGYFGNGAKAAEIASMAFNAWSVDYQTEKERIDHLKNHWNGIAGAASQLSMNLETKRQQHDQKEAQRNAMQ